MDFLRARRKEVNREMAKLGSKKRPAVVRVHTEEKAQEILDICNEHGWQVIVGIENDKPEDIMDVERHIILVETDPDQHSGKIYSRTEATQFVFSERPRPGEGQRLQAGRRSFVGGKDFRSAYDDAKHDGPFFFPQQTGLVTDRYDLLKNGPFRELNCGIDPVRTEPLQNKRVSQKIEDKRGQFLGVGMDSRFQAACEDRHRVFHGLFCLPMIFSSSPGTNYL
jgi:hypothetical protein